MASTASRVWPPVLAAGAVHAAFLALYLAKFGGDPSTLVCAGSQWSDQPAYRFVTRTLGLSGHDGQFYYALAQAPWVRHESSEIDLPAPRHMRILYPAMCWFVSGGDGQLLLYAMPAVNLAAIMAMTWMAVLLALHYDMSPWCGFLFPLAINAGLSLLHNFTDCLAMLAVLGLIQAYLRGAPWWALTLWFAASAFSREQNVAVAGVVLLSAAWSRRYAALAGFAVVLGLLLAWIGYLHGLYGTWPILPAQGNFHIPGHGMWHCWQHLGGKDRFSTRLAIIQAAGIIHLLLLMGIGGWLVFRQPSRIVALTLLGGLALALLGGQFIYEDFWSYTRVFAWLPMGIWLAALQLRLTWPMWALTPAALWPMVAALKYV